jgi:hypothetical protein
MSGLVFALHNQASTTGQARQWLCGGQRKGLNAAAIPARPAGRESRLAPALNPGQWRRAQPKPGKALKTNGTTALKNNLVFDKHRDMCGAQKRFGVRT